MDNNPQINSSFKDKEQQHTLKIRVLSTIVLLILLLLYVSVGFLYTDGIVFHLKINFIEVFAYLSMAGSIALVSLSIFELNKALGFSDWKIQLLTISMAVVIYLFPFSNKLFFHFYNYLNLLSWFEWYFPVVLLVVFFIIYIVIPLMWLKNVSIWTAVLNFAIMLIICFGFKGFSITSLDMVRSASDSPYNSFNWMYGSNTVVWVWMIIIFTDSFAYLGGIKFGKHKLAPIISPKKTWEGAIIGVSSATIVGAIYSSLFYRLDSLTHTHAPFANGMLKIADRSYIVYLMYLALSFMFSIIGVFGDLLFSWIKRYANIKDFSKLIPGHGGILDRLDATIFAMFFLYLFALIIK